MIVQTVGLRRCTDTNQSMYRSMAGTYHYLVYFFCTNTYQYGLLVQEKIIVYGKYTLYGVYVKGANPHTPFFLPQTPLFNTQTPFFSCSNTLPQAKPEKIIVSRSYG